MSLPTFWFVLIAVLWSGFLLLEGFDFGVGMLHAVLGGDDAGRRTAMSTIGGVWDGNEVWLVVVVAATFAAFPDWYATMFSGFYLLIVLLVVALIARGVALEFRSRSDDPRWHRTWDGLLSAGSLVAPFAIGVALGNLLSGVPIDSGQEFTGSVLDLLRPYPLAVGVTFVLLCLLHGATFLAVRTTGELRARSAQLARRVAPAAVVVVLAFAVWTRHEAGHGWLPGVLGVLAVVAVGFSALFLGAGRELRAFAATAVATAACVGAIFVELFPRVMVSSTNSSFDLTTHNAASPSYSLKVITVVAAVLVPVVLAYTAWTYVVLRRRISAPTAGIPRPRQPEEQQSGDVPTVRPRLPQ